MMRLDSLPACTSLALFLATAFISSCTESPDTEPDPGKIKVMMTEWTGHLGFYIATEKNFFAEVGLDVEVIHAKELTEVTNAYMAGDVQGRADVIFDAVTEKFEGLDHKIITAMDYSNGSDVIVARKEIQSPKDLEGKRIGFEEGMLTEYFLRFVLGQYNVPWESIIPVEAAMGDSVEMLQEGSVDAAVTFGPPVEKLRDSPDYHFLYTSADAPGLITDVIVFRTEFIEKYPQAMEKLVGAYFRAVDYSIQNPGETLEILAKVLNCSAEEAKAQLEGVVILDLPANLSAFSVGSGLHSLYGNVGKSQDFINPGRRFPPDSLIDKTFVVKYSNSLDLE